MEIILKNWRFRDDLRFFLKKKKNDIFLRISLYIYFCAFQFGSVLIQNSVRDLLI